MKLQKQKSRKTKKKTYNKWVVTIPPRTIEELKWKEGDMIDGDVSENKLVLSASRSKISKKTKIKKMMKGDKMMSAYDRFMQIYFNLPIPERSQVVVVINDKAISWDVAYKEIQNKTELGKKIEKKLTDLEII